MVLLGAYEANNDVSNAESLENCSKSILENCFFNQNYANWHLSTVTSGQCFNVMPLFKHQKKNQKTKSHEE